MLSNLPTEVPVLLGRRPASEAGGGIGSAWVLPGAFTPVTHGPAHSGLFLGRAVGGVAIWGSDRG